MKFVKVLIQRPENALVCDFCSSPKVYASHAATDFVVPWTKHTAWVHESKGGWAACKECDALIEAEDWKGLAQRSAEQYFENLTRTHISFVGRKPTRNGAIFQKVKQEMYELHQIFRKSRIKAA